MRARRWRVAVAGAGAVSENHLLAWAKLPDVELSAICDPVEERAEARARAFGIPKVYGAIETMLEAETPDALDIATPRQTHAAAIEACARRGVAALCQKPIAPTLAEARQAVAAARGRTRLMIHENWRFRPYYRALKRLLEEGRLGDPIHLAITVDRAGLLAPAGETPPALLRQPFLREEPRLILAETLIHHLDVARWLLGPLTPIGATLQRASRAVPGEDSAAVLLRAAGGASVLVRGSMSAAGFHPRADDTFSLIGTANSVIYADGLLSIRGESPGEKAFDPPSCYQASFDAAIAHFIDCLARGEEFETNPDDQLLTLALVEEAYAISVAVNASGAQGSSAT